MRIALVGCPGAGKTTVSSELCYRIQHPIINPHDVVRAYVESHLVHPWLQSEAFTRFSCAFFGAANSEELFENLRMGRYADQVKLFLEHLQKNYTEVRLSIIDERLSCPAFVPNFLLVGFPVRKAHALKLNELLEQRSMPLDAVISLDLPDDLALARCSGRLVHPPTGRTYHAQLRPPLVPGIDDVSGEPLTSRHDDREGSVQARLAYWRDAVVELKQVYGARFHTLHAHCSPPHLLDRLASFVASLSPTPLPPPIQPRAWSPPSSPWPDTDSWPDSGCPRRIRNESDATSIFLTSTTLAAHTARCPRWFLGRLNAIHRRLSSNGTTAWYSVGLPS